jgi:hypothetical protein
MWLGARTEADEHVAVLCLCPVAVRLEVSHCVHRHHKIITKFAGIVTITWHVWDLLLMMTTMPLTTLLMLLLE